MDRARLERGVGRRRLRIPAALLLIGGLAILMTALAPAAGAEPRTIIFDWLATPSWTSVTDPITGVGASYDDASDVMLTKGKVIFVTGRRDDAGGHSNMTLVKYRNGLKQWTVDYNGPANNDDTGRRMALSPDGKHVYVAGASINAATTADLVVVKRSAKTGALKWARRYDGPSHRDDYGLAVGVDAMGNVTAAGYSMNLTDPDWVVVSWTASGARRWVYRYKGPATSADIPLAALVAPDGTVYVCGYSVAGGVSAVTACISGRGTRVWLKKYRGSNGLGAQALDLAWRPGGGLYVCGASASSATTIEGMLLRYTAAGKRRDFAYDSGGAGATDVRFRAVAVTSTRDIVAVGSSTTTDEDCHVTLYHPDGSTFGSISLPGAWSDSFLDVAADRLGGYYATGTHHVAAGDCRILTVRGSVLAGGGGWYSQWSPHASIDTTPAAIAVRGTTCCVVGLYDSGGATGIDQAVLTYVY